MSVASIKLTISPRRMLDGKEAAEYCGLPSRHFSKMCTVTPVAMPNGDRRWDMQDLDLWINALKAGNTDDDDQLIEKLG